MVIINYTLVHGLKYIIKYKALVLHQVVSKQRWMSLLNKAYVKR